MNIDTVAIVGLGYVGLPVAVAFGQHRKTIGFDISARRLEELKAYRDLTCEVGEEDLRAAKHLVYTSDPKDLAKAQVIVVCVPTPVDAANRPDFQPLIRASEAIGKVMADQAIVVYESTVYPGATEEICVPILEKHSGKVWKKNFNIGYSPERINPGDKKHTLRTVKKVVAGDTADTLKVLVDLYSAIVDAGVYPAESIKVAEAAKILENTQRDINIALINECAMIFHRMGVDTNDVLDAACTKWNFLNFRPGLVGGHCIGVDPYYLTHKAEALGYHAKMLLAGRAINDGMGKYIAQQLIKDMAKRGVALQDATVGVLGLTFKENVPDLRNSKVIDIVRELQEFGVRCLVHDPFADHREAYEEYQLELSPMSDLRHCDGLVLAVKHRQFESLSPENLRAMVKPNAPVIDIKATLDRTRFADFKQNIWRL